VAAYGFNEGRGSAVADASGNGNAGVASGTKWAQGRFGNASLAFNGMGDWVTVADAASLDLTTQMTLEAWVYPTGTLAGFRDLISKEQVGGIAYSLYANGTGNVPVTGIFTGGTERWLFGTATLPLNVWTHLAATYDGVQQRLYVNGVVAASRPQTGGIAVSASPLRFGGNAVRDEFFKGRIDEVRVYNRALLPSEIQASMNRPVP
jgi:concanavalin A-like lectin/glucanase superfamily protein